MLNEAYEKMNVVSMRSTHTPDYHCRADEAFFLSAARSLPEHGYIIIVMATAMKFRTQTVFKFAGGHVYRGSSRANSDSQHAASYRAGLGNGDWMRKQGATNDIATL